MLTIVDNKKHFLVRWKPEEEKEQCHVITLNSGGKLDKNKLELALVFKPLIEDEWVEDKEEDEVKMTPS